jgi:hypothetical protein
MTASNHYQHHQRNARKDPWPPGLQICPSWAQQLLAHKKRNSGSNIYKQPTLPGAATLRIDFFSVVLHNIIETGRKRGETRTGTDRNPELNKSVTEEIVNGD